MNTIVSFLYHYRHQIMSIHPIPRGIVAAFGAVLGTIAGLKASPSDRLLDPFLLFFVPAWFLYFSARLYGFLKTPRSESFAFILGIPYERRRTLAGRHAKAAYFTVLISAGAIIAPFVSIRLFLRGPAELADSGALAALIAVEAFGGIALMELLLRSYFCKPKPRDRSRFMSIAKSAFSVTGHVAAVSGRLYFVAATLLSRPVPDRIRPYFRRQVLYLLRKDPFFSVVVPVIGFTAAIGIPAFMTETGLATAILADLFIPVVIFFANVGTFMESAERLAACPYYAQTPRETFLTNIWICGMLTAPFCALALVSLCAGIDGPATLASVAGFTGVLLCAVCIVVAFSHCLSSERWTGSGAAVMTVTLLCVFIGTVGAAQGSAIVGVAVPVIPIAMVGVVRKFS